MDERRALMAAIIANPDEDTPRLVFADWLQEHGDEHDRARAEFIRLQVQAARLPEGNPERKKLEKAADKLLAKHLGAWLAPLTAANERMNAGDERFRYFRRGLMTHIGVNTSDFLTKASQRAMPEALAAVGVESLLFYRSTKRIAALAASEAVRWVSEIDYYGADDAALAEFGKSPHFAHLSGLALGEVKATDAGLRAFAAGAGLTRLRKLGLTTGGGLSKLRGNYTTAGVLAVLNSERFLLLDSLDMEGGQPAKFDYRAFLADPGLKRITKLRLGPDVPMGSVAGCRNFANLRSLAINSALITDADADALLANPALPKLAKLEMYGINWGHPRLSKAAEKRLRARFGPNVLEYSPEER